MRLGLLGGVLQIYGGTWDIAWHIDRGRDSFSSAPHLVLYAGIVLVLTAAAIGLTAAATSGESLLRRLRQSPPLTAILLAALLQLSSAPIDEFWHRTFGRDVSVWSPPHFILIFGAATTFLALATLQLQQIKVAERTGRPVSRLDHLTMLSLIAFGTGMLLGTMIEKEFPGIPPWHPSQRREPWVYPAVTLAGSFGLTLAARVGRLPGSATWVAAILMTLRLTSAGLLLIAGWTHPHGPGPLVVAALVLDLTLGRLGWFKGALTLPLSQRERELARLSQRERELDWFRVGWWSSWLRIPPSGGSWVRVVGSGLAYGLVLWVVAAIWQSTTGLPGASIPAVVASAWLVAVLSVVGTLLGYGAAAFLEWLSEPRSETLIPTQAEAMAEPLPWVEAPAPPSPATA